MATVVLAAAGAAFGGSIGGTVLGVSSAVIGRAIGATIGRRIDERLLGQGSEPVETGRIDRFRIMGAQEGRYLPRVYGRMRLGGHVIWATRFKERIEETGGGKGGGPEQRHYSYSVSLAVALCEGTIASVGRIWADGEELARSALNMRVYNGDFTQEPDPLIEAVEGSGTVPAFRGTAYVVFEDLELARFGNRVPQLTFEVVRPVEADSVGAEGDLAQGIPGVALMPGTGEYALATTPVHFNDGLGRNRSANVNTPSGHTDFSASIRSLVEEVPGCGAVGLVVSWFGNDLRIGECSLQPKVEQKTLDGVGMPWQVCSVDRAHAAVIPKKDGLSIYGGTPCDAAVVEAIRHMNAQGLEVMFYPFILMEQGEGNGLPDPWTGADSQPVLPWRGRITTAIAAGRDGSTDGTIAAENEVSSFFGTASVGDFQISQGQVVYNGPNEWSYRRFVLHYAYLCKLAGGVESFCIGSEMRGMTQIRGAANTFPAVEALKVLAADVRQILGAETKISYAADWSEYFGYHPQDGSGDVYFHLDPLWSDENIDFIGIDNYMPLSDWREGAEHEDAYWKSIYNPDYLAANIEGGEGYDWYYHSQDARDAQIRTPIADQAYGEDWVWRYKDIRGWWEAMHHDRVGGLQSHVASPWVPGSKPIRFTEFGCAAIDKGSNQPNRFLDPKSSESGLPHYSNAQRDEFIQRQYFKAMLRYWKDPYNNPVSSVYASAMIDMAHAYAWAWDARPYPAFPNNQDLWSDAENYAAGHWLNGRTGARSIGDVLLEICENAGVADVDVSEAYGVVRGFLSESNDTARAEIQSLMLSQGIGVGEKDGVLVFKNKSADIDHHLSIANVVENTQAGNIRELRGSEAEEVSSVRFGFVEADGRFETVWEEATSTELESGTVSGTELSIALTRSEGRLKAENWLAETKVSRDRISFGVPHSAMDVGAGDVVSLEGRGRYRVDSVEVAEHRRIEAVRVDPEVYRAGRIEDQPPVQAAFIAPVPVYPLFLDLPMMTGDEVPHAPYVAVSANPWPGPVAVYNDGGIGEFELNTVISDRAVIGETETELAKADIGIVDRGEALQVRLAAGALRSRDWAAVLNGANRLAIGSASSDQWEILQFSNAELIGPDTYLISNRLRGQFGTDAILPDIWPVGSKVVLLDKAVGQISLSSNLRNLVQSYRVGPAKMAIDSSSYTQIDLAFSGAGLRPYAPCHLRVTQTTEGDEISWIRRSRIGGDSWEVPSVPLSEEVEQYQIRVFAGGVLKRDVVLNSPSWMYTDAMKLADVTTEGYRVEVAQLSAVYGAGGWAKVDV